MDPPERIYANRVLQQERQTIQNRNMDEHGDNAPPDHGNTALQLGLSATKDRRQYPELPVDSIFPAPVSSSSSSGISHVSPTSYESVLFSRFKEFGFIWDRAWIGFVVDPGILNIVKEYTEDFQDTTSFKIVGFQEFICDIECMDGMINISYWSCCS